MHSAASASSSLSRYIRCAFGVHSVCSRCCSLCVVGVSCYYRVARRMAGAYDERAWAINVETPEFFALFSAAETNSTHTFRRHCGLSTSDQESRDVFDRSLLQRARAHTVGATAVEEITLLHYLCCLTPLRKDIIALCVQADPSLLIQPSSIKQDTPAAYAVCCGNLPALHLLVQLSEQHLNSKHKVLHPN